MMSKMAVVPQVDRARASRDGEEAACHAGTRHVTRAMRMDAGGAWARAHAGTCFFNTYNTPVPYTFPARGTSRASSLSDALEEGVDQVELESLTRRSPQPATHDTGSC